MTLFDDFLEIKDLDQVNIFLENVYLKKVLSTIIGLLISNPPIIKFHKLFDDHGFLTDEKNLKLLQNEVKSLLYKILPKMLVCGFVSYYKPDEEDITISIVNYKNGRLKFKIDKKTHKISLHWFWYDGKESKLLRKLNMYEKEDKKVKHCIIDDPDIYGNMTGWLSSLMEKAEKIRLLEKYQIDIEKAKWENRFYIQKVFPEFDPNKYDVLQNHTFLMNTNPNDIDDPRKRFYNMHGVNRRIEFFEPDWKKRTEELITKYFNIRKFQDIGKDKKTGSLSVGELSKLIFPPINDYGPLLENLRIEFKELVSEIFGIRQTTTRALKDQARIEGFIVRTNTTKIQKPVEIILTKIFNDMIKPVVGSLAKEKIRELGVKKKENPEIEIPEIEDLQHVSIE